MSVRPTLTSVVCAMNSTSQQVKTAAWTWMIVGSGAVSSSACCGYIRPNPVRMTTAATIDMTLKKR
jgi:hypothetical protein